MAAGRGVHPGRVRLCSVLERDREGRLQLRRRPEGACILGCAALAPRRAGTPQAAGTVENRGGEGAIAPAAAHAGDRLSPATRPTALTCARNALTCQPKCGWRRVSHCL